MKLLYICGMMQGGNKLLSTFKVYLTEEGHIQMEKENLTSEQWREVVEEFFPDYENKTVIENFIIYLTRNTDKLYTSLSKYF